MRANDIRLLLLTSVAAREVGRQVAARDSLLQALGVAGARGVLRPFFEMGSALREMLIEQRGRFGRHEELLSTIVARWTDLETFLDRQTTPRQVAANLTPRELEVLHELPTLMTVEEIAAAHVVSANTIRTHMRGLYRKLGVHTRRDAVREGRRLGILP